MPALRPDQLRQSAGPSHRWLIGNLSELILIPVVRHLSKIRVEGMEKISRLTGPVVLISNNTSQLDSPIILAAIPRAIRRRTIVAAGDDYSYGRLSAGLVPSLALRAFPVERHQGTNASLGRAKVAIRQGWSVLLLPEKTRSKTGKLGHFKKGCAYICVDTKTAAIPIVLEGAYDVMPLKSASMQPGRVLIRIGDAVEPVPGDNYDTFTLRLHDAIVQLSTQGREYAAV